jgi:hypothetical protein
MTHPSTQPPVAAFQVSARFSLLLLCCVLLSTSGCFTRRRPALPWRTAILVRPIVPAAAPSETADTADPLPDLRLEIPPPPSPIAAAHSVPAKPRVVSAPSAENMDAENPAQPLITPALTPEDTAAAKLETQRSLEIANRNLNKARGRSLNKLQADLASKVRGFMDDARAALRNADWSRARTLAKKSEVLSQELLRSL